MSLVYIVKGRKFIQTACLKSRYFIPMNESVRLSDTSHNDRYIETSQYTGSEKISHKL